MKKLGIYLILAIIVLSSCSRNLYEGLAESHKYKNLNKIAVNVLEKNNIETTSNNSEVIVSNENKPLFSKEIIFNDENPNIETQKNAKELIKNIVKSDNLPALITNNSICSSSSTEKTKNKIIKNKILKKYETKITTSKDNFNRNRYEVVVVVLVLGILLLAGIIRFLELPVLLNILPLFLAIVLLLYLLDYIRF